MGRMAMVAFAPLVKLKKATAKAACIRFEANSLKKERFDAALFSIKLIFVSR